MEFVLVKVSKVAARKNHEGILNAAGISIREFGIGEASMANIAKAAGLTHGALYRHFPDKNALVSAAIERGFEKIVDLLTALKHAGQDKAAYIETYLDKDHRDHFVWGCPAAPLAAEMQRLDETIQSAFCTGLNLNLDALVSLSPNKIVQEARQDAISTLSALIGAMALARATRRTDPHLSDEILETVREQLTKSR